MLRLPRDVKNESSLLYTRSRDIHAVGIVLLQMVLGLDVTERFSDIHMALEPCMFSASSLLLSLIDFSSSQHKYPLP
jgi:translation initiation factor 2-alpha kinase 4